MEESCRKTKNWRRQRGWGSIGVTEPGKTGVKVLTWRSLAIGEEGKGEIQGRKKETTKWKKRD